MRVLGVALSLLLASVPATAGAPRVSPPPEVKASDAASFNVVSSARDWHQRLTSGSRCFLVDHPGGASELDGLARAIQRLPDAGMRDVYAAWLERELRPAVNAAAAGVAGKTWEELAKHRDESLAFLDTHAPGGTVRTPAEATAFAARAREFRDRALADHALVTRAMAETVCYTNAQASRDPRFQRFTWWSDQTAPEKIEDLVAKALHTALPATPGFDAVRRFLAEADPTDLHARGLQVRLGSLAWKQSQDELPIAELLVPLAELFPTAEQAELRTAPAAFAALRDKAQQRLVGLVDGAELPRRESTAKLDAIVRPLVSRARPVTWRVTSSSMERRDYTDHDTFERNGKTYLREWRVIVDLIAVAWVSARGDGNEVAVPGIPAKELCWIWEGSGKRYQAGRNVPLKRWTLSEQLVAPIRCQAAK